MEKLINDFKISFTKGDTYALAVKFKKITEDLRLAYFTVKENAGDEPLIQKSLGAGIDKIDDREYKKEKTYKVQLQSEDTVNLEARVQYLYDLRVTVDNVVKTVLSGVFVVSHSVAGASGTTTQSIEVAVEDEVAVEVETTPATNGIEYEQDPVANAKIGDLNELKTEVKDNLVQAINEVKNGTLKAEKATKDELGNVIHETYVTKEECEKNKCHCSEGNGVVISGVQLNENGELEFTYTDGSKQTIKLPNNGENGGGNGSDDSGITGGGEDDDGGNNGGNGGGNGSGDTGDTDELPEGVALNENGELYAVESGGVSGDLILFINSIAYRGFVGCDQVTSITFVYGGVPTIGAEAFAGCDNLQYLKFNCTYDEFMATYGSEIGNNWLADLGDNVELQFYGADTTVESITKGELPS